MDRIWAMIAAWARRLSPLVPEAHLKARRMPWRNRLLFTLSTLIVLFMAGAVYLAHERAMGLVHPGRTFPERTPEQVGLASVEDVRFPSSDGLLLAAWFIPPGEENPGPTVIFVHGLGANRSGLLDQAKR